MELTLIRKARFFASLCPTTFKVYTERGEELERVRLWNGQKRTFSLPRERYTVEASTTYPLLRPIVSTVQCGGAACDCLFVEAAPVRNNLLAGLVPGLALTVPLFEYDMQVRTTERAEKQPLRISAFPGRLLRVLSLLFFILSGYFFFLGLINYPKPGGEVVWALKGTDAYTMYTCEVIGEILTAWILPVLLFFLYRQCGHFSRVLLRQRRTQVLSEGQLPAPPFVLYLRSFYADKTAKKTAERILSPERTQEELLVSVLDDTAPVVAIGSPGDVYLPRGADRLYVSDSMWQERVEELAGSAELVVLRLGATEGFWWEVEFCLTHLPPEKLLFVIPNTRDHKLLNGLAEDLQARGYAVELPEKLRRGREKSGIAGFLTLREDGRALFTPLRRRPLLDAFTPAEDLLREGLSQCPCTHAARGGRRPSALRATVVWAAVLITAAVMAGNACLNFITVEQSRFPMDFIDRMEETYYTAGQLEGLSDRQKTFRVYEDAMLGAGGLDRETAVEFYQLGTELLEVLSDREHELLMAHLSDEDITGYLTDLLIVSKIYFTEHGAQRYCGYLGECVRLGLTAPQEPVHAMTMEGRVRQEMNRRLRELPDFAESGRDTAAAHRYTIASRQVVLDMYLEGYPMEPVFCPALIFLF